MVNNKENSNDLKDGNSFEGLDLDLAGPGARSKLLSALRVQVKLLARHVLRVGLTLQGDVVQAPASPRTVTTQIASCHLIHCTQLARCHKTTCLMSSHSLHPASMLSQDNLPHVISLTAPS